MTLNFQFPITQRHQLLDALWHFQDTHGCIRDEDVKALALALDISEVEIEGVISFYHFFHKEPRGKYTIYLNNSIMSAFHGFAKVRQAFERACGTRLGHVDPTGTFGLYETSCIGLSDKEPAALINFRPFVGLTPMRVHQIIGDLRLGKSLDMLADKLPVNIRYTPGEDKTVFLRPYVRGLSLEKLPELKPEDVLEEIKQAGIVGMGGAFFPAHIKWRSCMEQKSAPKYVVCNADEGEPGTFKDRALMQHCPGLLLEGMIMGAYVTGAVEGIIYLRAEYRYLYKKLEKEIKTFRSINMLGENILGMKGFNFDIRIQLGAGAYVCGEETAMLHSMEGKRGEPRAKIFFPTEKGFMDQPTLVNNVETFCAVARALELGRDFFSKLGTEQSVGTKLLSLSGDCERPGIYEIEWGMPLSELLELCGAEDTMAVQLGGPAGYLASEKDRHRQISVEDLRCGGSVMIFNHSRNLLQILMNYNRFFTHESCGICTPCRAGNYILRRQLQNMNRGMADKEDLAAIRALGKTMQFSSRCGLGQTAPNAIVDAIDHFPEFFEPFVEEEDGGLNKKFNIKAAVQPYEEAVIKNRNYE